MSMMMIYICRAQCYEELTVRRRKSHVVYTLRCVFMMTSVSISMVTHCVIRTPTTIREKENIICFSVMFAVTISGALNALHYNKAYVNEGERSFLSLSFALKAFIVVPRGRIRPIT